jgi:hypothetical protein
MTANDLELIDNYLDGELSEAERVAVEQRLAEDERLAREFEQHKILRKVIEKHGEAKHLAREIQGALQEEGFFNQFEKEKKPEQSNRWRYGCMIPAIALSAVILVALILGFLAIVIDYRRYMADYEFQREEEAAARRRRDAIPVFELPQAYKTDQEQQLLKAAEGYKVAHGQQKPDYMQSIEARNYAQALSQLDARIAAGQFGQDTVQTYLTAGRLCLYCVDSCTAGVALGYLTMARAHIIDPDRRVAVQEAFIVALLKERRFSEAMTEYDSNRHQLFERFPVIRGYIISIHL